MIQHLNVFLLVFILTFVNGQYSMDDMDIDIDPGMIAVISFKVLMFNKYLKHFC